MKAQFVAAGLVIATALAGTDIVHAQSAAKCLRMEISAAGSQAMWDRKADAEKSAIAAWTEKATKDAGPAYSKWTSAQRKSITCVPVSKSTIRCTAKGTPCL